MPHATNQDAFTALNNKRKFISGLCTRSLLLAAATVLFLTPASRAFAEISADHSAGAMIVGPTTVACDSSTEGSIRYNNAVSAKYFEICNGTTWNPLGNMLATRPDVVITNVQGGQTLIYNAGLNKWTNNACYDVPTPVTFTSLTQQALSTQVTSNIVQINGIACSADTTVIGEGVPEYRICSDAGCSSVVTNWTRGTPNPIISGQYIQLRMNTSPVPGTIFTANLKIGLTSSTPWTVRTIMPKRAFITSTSSTGNLSGLAGADLRCQNLADAVPLGGTYKAWLSDGTTSAASRFTQFASYYTMVNGTRIANNWADLTDGTIAARLNVTESGATVSSAVWTNTSISGGITGTRHCSNWVIGTSAQTGSEGTTGYADYSWTADTYNNCNQIKRLYCFEQ